MKRLSIAILLVGLGLFCWGAQDRDAQERAPAPPAASSTPAPTEPALTFEEYEPKSTLVVPANPVTRARFPFIDVHNHQNGAEMSAEKAAELVAEMDKLNLAVMVNLSGSSGERLAKSVANMKGRYPKRFVLFANVDFAGIDAPDWGRKAAAQLEADVRERGAQGLKIFKNLGMSVKDASGKIVPADDPRIDPVWAKCAELGIPVLIHTGEPKPFFDPVDRFNERWLELKQFPSRRRPPSEFGTWEEVMAAQQRLFRNHPRTQFINAHLGWLGNDLGRLGRQLDELPNVTTEMGAVLAEIGRQPRNARAFLIRYQDRVMFGKDIWAPVEYHTYFRVLETADEYFDYYRRRHAFWQIYGADLPDDVLKKIYYKNALRVIPGIDPSGFPE
jgi:uncharacterized protein